MATDVKELMARVGKIRILTNRLIDDRLSGDYHSTFKGQGVEFDEVRPYIAGDDVRTIDWNVTARFNKPFIKVFEEERELTVMLLVDLSESLDFGTSTRTKREMLAEIAATIAFAAIQNNDKIGVIFFTDRIEKFIPPQKGRKHILYIIRELLNIEPVSKRTDIKVPLEFLTNALKKKCTAFLLSDFICTGDYSNALTIANRKHDLAAIQVYDRRLAELPDVGLIKVRDAESDVEMYIDTSSGKVREAQRDWWRSQSNALKERMQRSRVDSVSVRTDQDYVKALLALFAQRA